MSAQLDSAALRARLAPGLASRLDGLECVDRVDSTNSALLRRARTLPARHALVAEAQSAGRGRHGRVWHSPPVGNLYLSLFARLDLAPSALAGLSLAAGVSCAEALHAMGYPQVRLKWPNDLLAAGRKLGGLLVEVAPAKDRAAAVVIGLGLNLRPVAADGVACAALSELGPAPELEAIAAAMLGALLDTVDAFERDGLASFVVRWPALDALHGQPVRVLAGARSYLGTATGLTEDGALRVSGDDGERCFRSADVSLRPL